MEYPFVFPPRCIRDLLRAPPFIVTGVLIPPIVVNTSTPLKAEGLEVDPVHPVLAPAGSVNPIPEKWALLELEYTAGLMIIRPPF